MCWNGSHTMYIENFWGGRGSSKYYHGYIEGGWGYKSPKNVLRSMWLIPYHWLYANEVKSILILGWRLGEGDNQSVSNGAPWPHDPGVSQLHQLSPTHSPSAGDLMQLFCLRLFYLCLDDCFKFLKNILQLLYDINALKIFWECP